MNDPQGARHLFQRKFSRCYKIMTFVIIERERDGGTGRGSDLTHEYCTGVLECIIGRDNGGNLDQLASLHTDGKRESEERGGEVHVCSRRVSQPATMPELQPWSLPFFVFLVFVFTDKVWENSAFHILASHFFIFSSFIECKNSMGMTLK